MNYQNAIESLTRAIETGRQDVIDHMLTRIYRQFGNMVAYEIEDQAHFNASGELYEEKVNTL